MKTLKYVIKQIYFSVLYILFKDNQRASLNRLKVIHFVCKGNICRSAFSEYYATNLFKTKGISIDVISSGLSADQAEKSPEEAIIAAKIFDVDLSEHKPKVISKEIIDRSSIIIGMHYQNVKDFNYRYPKDKEKIFLLKHLTWPKYLLLNINDPFGLPIDEYIKCFSDIKKCIDMLADKIESSAYKYTQSGRIS
jgi:protein-tyrosine phosphatase